MKDNRNYISMTFGKDEQEIYIEGERSMAGESLMNKILTQESQVLKVPADIMKNNIAEEVSQFVDVLDEVNVKSGGFEIDEVEFGICVGADGAISIASVLNGGVNAQTTIKIKLKRKENK